MACSSGVRESPSSSEDKRQSTPQELPKMLERPNLKGFEQPKFQIGDEMIAYQMNWRRPQSGELLQKLEGAVKLLSDDKDLAFFEKENLLKTVLERENAGSWIQLPNSPLFIKYDTSFNEIRIINEEREAQADFTKVLGEDAIKKQAELYLKQLAENQVIDYQLYETAAMQLGYAMVGSGSFSQKVQPAQITSFRITYRPRLNGVELANAGIRMGINLAGVLTSLRVGGVSPEGEWKNGSLQSNIPNSRRKIAVTTNDLMSKFYNEKLQDGEVQVSYSKVMYAMPEGKSEAIVEPLLVISYSDLRTVDNHPVVSRRKTLAYSLTNPEAQPLDFDKPRVQHEGTEPLRKN